MQVTRGETTTDRLARELSRVTEIIDSFLSDVERVKNLPPQLRAAATMARLELDGHTVER